MCSDWHGVLAGCEYKNRLYALCRMSDASRGKSVSCVGVGYFIVKAICVHDYRFASLRDACPGLYEFMVADLVYMVFLALVILSFSCWLEWHGESLLAKLVMVFVFVVVLGMYAGKVYVIQLSWFSETCKEASSNHISGQTDMGGHRVLEILGWVDISWQSMVLLCGFCACVPAILSQ